MQHPAKQASIAAQKTTAANKDVALKLPAVKKEKLERALKQFDENFCHSPERHGWTENQAQRYAISANGTLYPAKKIVSLATSTPVGIFSGGQPTNGYLKRHSYTIVDLTRSTEPELKFIVGQVYDRQTEIHDLFGGGRQSGISASAQAPAIFTSMATPANTGMPVKTTMAMVWTNTALASGTSYALGSRNMSTCAKISKGEWPAHGKPASFRS